MAFGAIGFAGCLVSNFAAVATAGAGCALES